MRLAMALGRTVEELGESMDSSEFTAWLAREALEPLPDPWLQTGIQTAAAVNLWAKKRTKPTDFMPVRKRPRPRMSGAQMARAMANIPGVTRTYG
jgi:hypothetical protein